MKRQLLIAVVLMPLAVAALAQGTEIIRVLYVQWRCKTAPEVPLADHQRMFCLSSDDDLRVFDSGGTARRIFREGLSAIITAVELAADSVAASEIAADAVGSSEIAADAVGASEIVADGVGSSEIAADAVGSSEIAADAVGTGEIAANAVGATDLGIGVSAGDIIYYDGTDWVVLPIGGALKTLRVNAGGTAPEWTP